MNWHNTWATKFEELLFAWRPDLRTKTVNLAAGGSNIKNMLERLDTLIMPCKPDWIVFTVGNNDPHQGITADEFEKCFNQYKSKTDAKLVFIGGFCGDPFFDSAAPYYMKIKKAADGNRLHYLDAGTPLAQKAALLKESSELHTVFGDGVHLNELGAYIVAGTVLKFFRVFDGI